MIENVPPPPARSEMDEGQLIDLCLKVAQSIKSGHSADGLDKEALREWMAKQADALSTTARILAWKLENLR